MTPSDVTPTRGRSLRSTISSSGELRLELAERDVSEPVGSEVVIAVEASPINPSDLGVLLGAVAPDTLQPEGEALVGSVPDTALPLYRDRLDKPLPVGNEGAGTVVAAGPDASALIGRRVATFGGSMWADYRVADAAAVKACCEQVQNDLGPVNILVNNAGVIADGLFVRMEPEDWDKVVKINLGGVFHFCRELAFPMMQKRAGRIINVSSVAATHVNPGQANYAASKGAVNSFTRALAVELSDPAAAIERTAASAAISASGSRETSSVASLLATATATSTASASSRFSIPPNPPASVAKVAPICSKAAAMRRCASTLASVCAAA